MLNDILPWALSSANVPSQLECTGLDSADGEHFKPLRMHFKNGGILHIVCTYSICKSKFLFLHDNTLFSNAKSPPNYFTQYPWLHF